MCTYKGNVGHLMQHWTLCELLVAASGHTSGLSFIDAHAMAPLARERQNDDARFTRAEGRLPNRRESAYERAWHHLAPNGGYPNSAAFVERVWERDFSLLLCETDALTIEELRPWCQRVRRLARCQTVELFRGDWRGRFGNGLPSPAETGLADGSLTLVSFDPYMYNKRRGANQHEGNVYPEDIELAMRAMDGLKDGILMQLSTYSANDGNAQGAAIASVNSILRLNNFSLVAVVRVDGNMMSLVYERNVPWAADLTDLPTRFDTWLSEV